MLDAVNILLLVLMALFVFAMLRHSSRSQSAGSSSEPWVTPQQELENKRSARRSRHSAVHQENVHQNCYKETCRIAARVERMQNRSLFAEPPSYPALSAGDEIIDGEVTDIAGLLP